MALKSKNIEDYFEGKLADLRPGAEIQFDVYLYFSANRHILLWKKNGEVLTDGFLDRYRERGVQKVYIHRSEMDAYYAYLNPALKKEEEPAQAPAVPPAPEEAPPAAIAAEAETTADAGTVEEAAPAEAVAEAPPKRTEQGEKIAEILKSQEIEEKLKQAMVAKEARDLLRQTAEARDRAAQEAANAAARKVIQDVLDEMRSEAESVAAEIWKLANVDPDLEHAVNVATFACIFAMAFGRIDQSLISDLALAGLMHDVGLSQVSASVTSLPWKSFKPEQLKAYSAHVDSSLELIEEFAPEIPPRVRAIIQQHHEKFDGTGYPRRLQGFKVDDIAALLSIADTLDSISSGQWDGVERTLNETFQTLERVEKARTFPEHFNPDVFAAVMRWIKNTGSTEATREAIKVVGKQIKGIVKEKPQAA